jgi:hypothetical protein
MRRARRLLRSLERARVARRRLIGQPSVVETNTPDLDALHQTILVRLAALQHESRYGASPAGIDDLAHLLARAERALGGA